MKGNFKDAVKILWNGSQHKKERGEEYTRVEKAEQVGKGTMLFYKGMVTSCPYLKIKYFSIAVYSNTDY